MKCSLLILASLVFFVYFFFLITLLPPISTLFPYTTLFRSSFDSEPPRPQCYKRPTTHNSLKQRYADRKSTRLNSSHRCISYAVFCLKKKKNNEDSNQVLVIHSLIT